MIMEFLLDLMRSLHYAIGITAPAPEKERLYLLIWAGIVALLVAECAFLIHLVA